MISARSKKTKTTVYVMIIIYVVVTGFTVSMNQCEMDFCQQVDANSSKVCCENDIVQKYVKSSGYDHNLVYDTIQNNCICNYNTINIFDITKQLSLSSITVASKQYNIFSYEFVINTKNAAYNTNEVALFNYSSLPANSTLTPFRFSILLI